MQKFSHQGLLLCELLLRIFCVQSPEHNLEENREDTAKPLPGWNRRDTEGPEARSSSKMVTMEPDRERRKHLPLLLLWGLETTILSLQRGWISVHSDLRDSTLPPPPSS